MNAADTTSPNTAPLPPPTLNDERYLMLPPTRLRIPMTMEDVKKGIEHISSGRAEGMLGTLALKPEMAYTLEMARPEYQNKVKLPSARDDSYVYDNAGNQLFNTDRTPKEWKKLGMKPVNFAKPDENPTVTDIEGKPLVYVDRSKQKKTGRGKIASKLFGFEDSRLNFMALEASVNAHWGKIVEDVKNTGPDHKYRILWSEYNKEGGYWQDYKGNPLDEQQLRMMEHEIKVAALNPAYAMACAKYEITKREEELRVGPEGTWVKLLNVMHKYMKFSPKNTLGAVHVGLIFMRKTEDLTIKHTKIEYLSGNHKPLDPSSMNKAQWDAERVKGSYVKLGPMNERAFVTEFATKFGQGDRRFGTGDIAVMVTLAEELERRLDAAGENTGLKNRRRYQNAAFIASRMRSVVNDSRMSPSVTGETDVDKQLEEMRSQPRQEYPARVYSSAVANDHWRELAKVVDRISKKHSIVLETNMRDDIDTRGTVRQDNRP